MNFEMIIGLSLIIIGLFIPFWYRDETDSNCLVFLKTISILIVVLGIILVWFSTLS